MDKMREGFEAWAKTSSLKNFLFWHPYDNQYEVHAVQMAFEGWKASRAELRSKLIDDHGKYRDEMDAVFDDVEVIDKAGVSYKQQK